jgi:phosphoglycerate dehydrogenase-like enzyme
MRERTALQRHVLERLPRLKLVVTTGNWNASVDNVCLAEAGVVFCGTGRRDVGAASPAPGIPSTAEVGWALILAACKRVTAEDRAIRVGRWQLDLPVSLAGATLGLAGLGHLGSAMVGPARAFGMDVIAWSQNLTDDRAAAVGVRRVSKAGLLASSDVLSIHLVLSDRTRGLFQADDLAQMKRTAVLINTSRRPLVDERALIDALRTGTIAAAGLDVYGTEPLPPGHELTTLDNVVLLPHLGYVSEPGFRHMYRQVVEAIAAFLAGSPVRVITGDQRR